MKAFIYNVLGVLKGVKIKLLEYTKVTINCQTTFSAKKWETIDFPLTRGIMCPINH